MKTCKDCYHCLTFGTEPSWSGMCKVNRKVSPDEPMYEDTQKPCELFTPRHLVDKLNSIVKGEE